METVKNDFRVSVRRCCASCGNKEVQNDGTRWCPVAQRQVGQCDVCDRWTMSSSVAMAGAWRGRVKERSYLLLLQAVRAEYEAKYKSIYLIH